MLRIAPRLAVIVSAVVGIVAPAVVTSTATAAPTVVFTESFEECTDPVSEPDYTDYETATQSNDPIYVNLWVEELINCEGWVADGQAWMTTYSSGGSFPDGTHAAWLNEGPTAGSIETTISGLTAGHDYTLSLDTWVDDQDAKTSLLVEVTNGSDVTHITLKLQRGQGIQPLSHNFSAVGDTVTLKLIGSEESPASPLVDNIVITDAGLTPDPVDSSADLASTGFNTVDGILVVVGLLIAGVVAFAVRRVVRR